MIVQFLDKNFNGLQNNASLVVDIGSFNLIKRPCEMNDLTCTCEAFTEDIQPTFLVIKDNKGKYVYGSLAGIPVLNGSNKTEITGTDLKSMLSSDVIFDRGTEGYDDYFDDNVTNVNQYLTYLFNLWDTTVNQNSFTCELVFNTNVGTIAFSDLTPSYADNTVINAWEEMQAYLKYYDLFLDSSLDLVNKKVKFIVGKTRHENMNIKLWEYGIKNYGKWIAAINETQGYYLDEENNTMTVGETWTLLSNNSITNHAINDNDSRVVGAYVFENREDVYVTHENIFDQISVGEYIYIKSLKALLQRRSNSWTGIGTVILLDDVFFDHVMHNSNSNGISLPRGTFFDLVGVARDMYPIKKQISVSSESLEEANKEALTILLDNLFNENIELPTTTINPTFETNFAIYVKKGQEKYKDLPCGELRYNDSGLYQVQVGYRYSNVNFI